MPEFNMKSYAPVLATAYGEAASEPYEDKVHVLSSIYNRAMSGREEFGAETGEISKVLEKGYYAYSKQSPKFQEAMDGKFPDKQSEDAYKEIVAIWSGLMKGKIKPTETLFFLTPKEVAKIKKSGKRIMDMDLLEEVGKGKTWNFYKYKTASPKRKRANKSLSKR